jgi:hypothetical protein
MQLYVPYVPMCFKKNDYLFYSLLSQIKTYEKEKKDT